MMFYLLLFSMPVLVLMALLVYRSNEKKSYSWVQFFAKGKDAGFSFKEIELLRRMAVKVELEDPSALFWNERELDRCIRALVQKAKLTGEEREQDTQDFFSKLYEYRKKIEFEHPKYKKGIESSRNIMESQHIRVLVDGAGVFKAQVQRNSDRFLTVTRPTGPQLPANFTWKGRRVAVYFWRRNDAGYVFDTYVLDEVQAQKASVLQLAHSDSLFRTQKRRSIRARTHKSAFLYLPQEGEAPEKLEVDPGLKCIIEDLSETGCAVTIGGRAQVGMKVKVQFELEGVPVVMSGQVRSSDFYEDKNRSLLHIESEPLSMATRNRILAAVFGVQSEDDYSEAFSLLEKEDPFSTENSAPQASGKPEEAVLNPGGHE